MGTRTSFSVQLLDDPGEFLEVAADHLRAHPVTSTVVATVTERMVREDAAGVPRPAGPACWWAVVRDADGAVVGTAMRTAPFAPYPPSLTRMPEEAAVELARLALERGDPVDGVNGALPSAAVCAAEIGRRTGRVVRVVEHVRLFELGELVRPPAWPAGRLRRATEQDLALALAWYGAFGAAAAEQAGRSEPHTGPEEDEASMRRRIDEGRVFLWERGDGKVVHLTGANPPSFGVARIGPVYTPPEHRGRGYAAAAVHEVSRQIRDSGARACLFTDQANPVSNALYQRLGYVAVADQVNQVLEPAPPAAGGIGA
jgi:RimJ/RimL family protein N-acetyltransferase